MIFKNLAIRCNSDINFLNFVLPKVKIILPHTIDPTPMDMSAPKLFLPGHMLRMIMTVRARMTSSANRVRVIITWMDRNQATKGS